MGKGQTRVKEFLRSLVIPRPIGLGLGLGLVAWLIGVLLTPFPRAVERIYSTHFYLFIVDKLSRVSAFVPFSMTHLSLGIVFLLVLIFFFLGLKRGRFLALSPWARMVSGGIWALGAAGAAYFLFLLFWGFNYKRQTVSSLIGAPDSVSVSKKKELLSALAKKTNYLRGQIPRAADFADPNGCFDLAANRLNEIDRRVADLEAGFLHSWGLPVPSYVPVKINPPFFLRPFGNFLLQIGNSGIYGPFTGEANITLPSAPGMLAFTLAHERAHLNGFASETDASVIAFLTLETAPEPELRYAGQLAFWDHLGKKIRNDAGLGPEAEQDIQCINDFWERYVGFGMELVHGTYDLYLKAQGQKRGIKTYSDATDVVLRYWSR